MTKASLRSSITKRIRNFPKEKLLVVENFVSYLAERNSDSSTSKLLNISGLLSEVHLAKKEFVVGKGTEWRKVRRAV